MRAPRFQRLRQGKLHEQALEYIRAALLAGEYRPGDRLLESDIAEQMGVSRGPIREAIRQLEQEGLVTSKPHRGTFVTTTSPEEAEHLLAVRTLLESYAIRQATRRVTAADIAELRRIVQRMRAALDDNDLAEVAECVVRVHRGIVELAGSPTLTRIWSTMVMLIRSREFVMFQQTPDPDLIADEVVSHERVVEALASRDPKRAERAIVADIGRQTFDGMSARADQEERRVDAPS